jgi:hypothetical protein
MIAASKKRKPKGPSLLVRKRQGSKETIFIPIRPEAKCMASVTVQKRDGKKQWWAVFDYETEGYGGLCTGFSTDQAGIKCLTRDGAISLAVAQLLRDMEYKAGRPHVGHASLPQKATSRAYLAAADIRTFYKNESWKQPAPTPKAKRADVLDNEIKDFMAKRGLGCDDLHPKRAPGKAPKPQGTAIAAVPSSGPSNLVVEMPLTKAERCQLATLKKVVDRTMKSTFEFGAALREIRDRRLYRETHSSFEAFMADEFGISKPDAHRQIQAATKFEAAQPIAAKLGISLTNPSQMRPLFNVADDDLAGVLKKASRLVPKAADGSRRLTAEVLTRAVREETMAPDDFQREAERKKERERLKPGRHIAPVAIPVTFSPPQTPADLPPPETPIEAPTAPLGANLDFDQALYETRCYLECLLRAFDGRVAREGMGFLSGMLRFFSKRAAGIRACRVCGCSELDPCDERGGCHWLAGQDDLCSACEDRDEVTARRAK